MRKLIFAINTSLDGFCDHDKLLRPDEQAYAYYTQLVSDADTFVYGRKTYQLMVPYWPDVAKNPSDDQAENEYAQAFVAIKKIIVCSRSLADEGGKTEIVRTDIQSEILKLKKEPGKDILTGGVDIPSQLMALNLIDEYRFVVHPILAGAGRRLLEDINLPERLQLKLVETKTFRSGIVALRYLKQ